jgi:hypothetical protein
VQKGIETSALLGRFMAAVRSIGKTIIDEFHLDASAKTIRPCDVGGDTQGGTGQPTLEHDELFICNGILFRFASDPRGAFYESKSHHRCAD